MSIDSRKKVTEDLYNETMTTEQAIPTDYDPLHLLYIYMQNLLPVLTESLQETLELALNRLFTSTGAADGMGIIAIQQNG